jgi:DNA polymerase-3 subunit gamma/tau
MDLLEIDAASNTGVDDVREVIENAQYAPSRGNYKVYLIDEVHMLSKNAFNALLKTLEEPPPHVKFLLATTDPQKLPVTVLSRCLQFNLRRLEQAQIAGQIGRILDAEGIPSEPAAVALLARAADGSLRDGLSLLDQAIAYTGGRLEAPAVTTMLGSVDRTRVAELLDALAAGDGPALLAHVEELAAFSPDFGHVLDDVATALHQVQLQQVVPGSVGDAAVVDVAALAARLAPELVQLWYQMAITGRRDLGLAPSPRTGFEMSLLRMLAFRPAGPSAGGQPASAPSAGATPVPTPVPTPSRGFPAATAASTAPAKAGAAPGPAAGAPVAPRAPSSSTEAHAPAAPATRAAAATTLRDADDWLALVARAGLKGPVRELAAHSAFCGHADGVLQLSLPDSFDHLRSEGLVRQLAKALADDLGGPPQIRFESARAAGAETLHARTERQRGERQAGAEQAFVADPVVARLLQQGGTVVADSIRPLDDH